MPNCFLRVGTTQVVGGQENPHRMSTEGFRKALERPSLAHCPKGAVGVASLLEKDGTHWVCEAYPSYKKRRSVAEKDGAHVWVWEAYPASH